MFHVFLPFIARSKLIAVFRAARFSFFSIYFFLFFPRLVEDLTITACVKPEFVEVVQYLAL